MADAIVEDRPSTGTNLAKNNRWGFLERLRKQPPLTTPTEQEVVEPNSNLLGQFRKRVENDPYSKTEEKEATLRRLEGMEEVRQGLMEFGESELQDLESAFKVYFGELVTNLAFLKGGVDVAKFVKERRPEFNLPPYAIDITDNSGVKDYINNKPLTHPTTEESKVVEALGEKLGLDTRQLLNLRGALSVIPVYINSLMIIDPPPHIVNPDQWESDSLAAAKAGGIHPIEDKKQEIASHLTEIQITDRLVDPNRKAAHVDVKIPLPEGKRDPAHYVLNASIARAMEYTTSILAVVPPAGFK